ncbi:MAG: hypothetical protein ACXAC6_07205 [Candidatus Hodarchaeales archaeon]|jgi:hypothetical protein
MKLKTIIPISLIIFLIIAPQSAMADKITWHSDVKVGSLFTWKVTEVENATNLPTIASQIPTLNDTWQLHISSNPPTSGSGYIYNANNTVDYVNFYVNDVKVNLSTLEYYEVLLILMMILPVYYTDENNTRNLNSFPEDYIAQNLGIRQQYGMSYDFSTGGSNYWFTFQELGRANFKVNTAGIMVLYNFRTHLYVSESGNMTAIYQGFEVVDSIDSDSTDSDSKDGDEDINFPELSVILLAGIMIVLIKKAISRKKKL